MVCVEDGLSRFLNKTFELEADMKLRSIAFAAGLAAASLSASTSWEPAAFNITRSFDLLFMVIIGGLGSIMGSFFGAAFIVIVPIVLDNLPNWFGIPIDTALASHLTF